MNGRPTETAKAAKEYIKKWRQRGYERDIPHECPQELSSRGLAPSYKAICLAILQNDIRLKSISPKPDWRKEIKQTQKITEAIGFKKEKQEKFHIEQF